MGIARCVVVVVDGPLELSKIDIFLFRSRKSTIPIFGMLGGVSQNVIPYNIWRDVFPNVGMLGGFPKC